MKELNNFRKFLKEDLDEGMFDKFKKELGDVIKTYKELEKAATSGGDGSSRATKDRQLKADAKKAGVEFKEEQTSEILGMGKNREDMKVAKALDSLEKALFELNFLGVISDNDYNNFWMNAYGELYTDTMGELDPAVRKKYGFGELVDEELDENDIALDEIINEAKPNLKKALPKIAARNVERNNNINFDIESMMDMVGEAGKGENSEEAKILFKASNASSDLEQALVDLQVYFEDDLGEGKKEE